MLHRGHLGRLRQRLTRSVPAADEARDPRGFADYLENTEFSEYRLLGEPAIGLAWDGSVARAAYQLKVAAERRTRNGTSTRFDSV